MIRQPPDPFPKNAMIVTNSSQVYPFCAILRHLFGWPCTQAVSSWTNISARGGLGRDKKQNIFPLELREEGTFFAIDEVNSSHCFCVHFSWINENWNPCTKSQFGAWRLLINILSSLSKWATGSLLHCINYDSRIVYSRHIINHQICFECTYSFLRL